MNRLIRSLIPAGMLLLGACAALGGKHGSFAIYAPRLDLPAAQESATGRSPIAWQLLVDAPRTSAALDTTRIAVMPRPGVLEVYPDARWRDTAPTMLRSLVVQAFDHDGRIGGVSATDSGLNGDFSLSIELRDFQVELAGESASAAIRLTTKLFDRRSNRIVASQAFDEVVPAAGSDIGSAIPAFEQALNQLLPKVVDWTVRQGEAHNPATPAGEPEPA
ncbi:MAG TPA: ABC-type transport auxiliary lipoprotein family protein [Dokdonella sp.]|jgi:cholesterol transport system auxiliary component|nr:ABC-type transport auxiliary lipoprotein family protein [Dokdonella sp.]